MLEAAKKPKLLAYSLVLPALWLAVGSAMNFALPGKRLGVLGLAAVVYVFSSIVAWHFAKTFRRHFAMKERLKLILYSATWAVLVELLALYSYIADQPGPMANKQLLLTIAITVAVDTLYIWLGFTFVAKRRIQSILDKGGHSVT